VTIVSLSLDSF